jgi:VWFA-related protein
MGTALLFALILSSLSGVAAQIQSGGTFKAGVTVIQVPVVVRDRNGHIVSNLGKDDFQLFDNGKRQEITSFSVESAGGRTAPDRSLPDAQPPVALSPGGTGMEIPARYFAYVFDDLTFHDFGDLKRVRDAAARQFGALRASDRAAIFTTSCRVELDFTNDRLKLQEAVSQLELHFQYRVKHGEPASVCRALGNQILQVELLKTVVAKLSSLPARRDIIILVSTGFVVGQRLADEADLIEAAVRANVSIDAVDVGGSAQDSSAMAMRGSWGLQSAGVGANASLDSRAAQTRRYDYPTDPLVLVDLAHGTGGTYLTGNDFGLSFRKLATPENHYLLGFVPTARADGRFHRLKVKLGNARTVTVGARSGYYAQ